MELTVNRGVAADVCMHRGQLGLPEWGIFDASLDVGGRIHQHRHRGQPADSPDRLTSKTRAVPRKQGGSELPAGAWPSDREPLDAKAAGYGAELFQRSHRGP